MYLQKQTSIFKGGLWKPQASIEYRMCLAKTHHWFAWNVRDLLYSPNACFLESLPGSKKLSVSLLMEIQINIEMYFYSRRLPQAPILFWREGGLFLEACHQYRYSIHFTVCLKWNIAENYNFLSKMSMSKGGFLLSPNLKSQNPFLKRGAFY